MDEARAVEMLEGVLSQIDAWGATYDERWGRHSPYQEHPELDQGVRSGRDAAARAVRQGHDIVTSMGEAELAARIVEHEEGQYGGHPFSQARKAVVEAIATLESRSLLAELAAPTRASLGDTQVHRLILEATSSLWRDGHHKQAVQQAATALEGRLQQIAGSGLSGEKLAIVFSLSDASPNSPRLRIRDLAPGSQTYRSAHEGAAALVRGAFMAIRNLVSHPGWPDPPTDEALEMLATMSYLVRLIDRADVVNG